MRDPIILLVHLIATLARLMGPGGLRSVVAESVLVKQQLLILNRSRTGEVGERVGYSATDSLHQQAVRSGGMRRSRGDSTSRALVAS